MPTDSTPLGNESPTDRPRRTGWQRAIGFALIAIAFGVTEYARWHHVAIWLFGVVLLVGLAVGPYGFDLLGMRGKRARALQARRERGDTPLTFRKDWPRIFRSWSNYDLTTREQFRVAMWTVGCAIAVVVAIAIVAAVVSQA